MTSIIQFADIHFGVEDKDAMAAVAATIEKLEPDVILICGDITQNGSVEEFEAARDWIMTLSGPKIITPGNHDTPMFGLVQRLFDPFGRYKRFIAPLGQGEYVDETVHIKSINTARGWQFGLDWSLGVVDLNELDRVIADFTKESAGRLKLLIAHHPFVYPPSSPLQKTTKNGLKALEKLSAANVDGVVSGHVHVPFVLERQPDETAIMSIGAGTLSTRRRDKPAGFSHIVVTDDVVSVSPIEWEDGQFFVREAETFKISELKSREVN